MDLTRKGDKVVVPRSLCPENVTLLRFEELLVLVGEAGAAGVLVVVLSNGKNKSHITTTPSRT
jgi:hypothetical protein